MFYTLALTAAAANAEAAAVAILPSLVSSSFIWLDSPSPFISNAESQGSSSFVDSSS